MSTYVMYFSPTGGTKKAAELFAEGWKDRQEIDLCKKEEIDLVFQPEDVCIAAVPSYGGRVPATALSRIAGMHGNGAAAVLLAAYGNRAYDDTLLELKDMMTECGFRVAAAVAAVTEHSIMHQFGTGRPDAADAAQLGEFSKKARAAVQAAGNKTELKVPGSRPYREYNGVPLKPKAGSGCTECGICASLCPVGAISMEHPSKTDTKRCISCMRCIKVCPKQARSLNPVMLAGASMKLKKECEGRKENELLLPE